MSRVSLFLFLGLYVPSVVFSFLLPSLDLMIVIDDSSRLRQVGGRSRLINNILTGLLLRLEKEAKDARIGLVTYNDKTLLPYISCEYTKQNYCSRLRLKLQHWNDTKDFRLAVAALPYEGSASDQEPSTDMYAGIMTALGHDAAGWREQTATDPIYRSVFVIAGALPRQGGLRQYGGIPKRFPNTGAFYADCAADDYYTLNQVLAKLRMKATNLYIVSYPIYVKRMTDIVNSYHSAFTTSILKSPDWIAEDFVSKLVFYKAASGETSGEASGPTESPHTDLKRRVLGDSSDDTENSDASELREQRETLCNKDF